MSCKAKFDTYSTLSSSFDPNLKTRQNNLINFIFISSFINKKQIIHKLNKNFPKFELDKFFILYAQTYEALLTLCFLFLALPGKLR